MKRLSVTIAVMLGLLCPAPAVADTLIGGVRVSESLRIAQEFWGGETPHCTAIRVYYAPLKGDIVGLTRKPKLDEPAVKCPIWITDLYNWNDYFARIEMCTTIVHEYGHLLQRRHDTTKNSVMNESLDYIEVYACYRRFLPRGEGRAWRDIRVFWGWAIRPW